MWGWGLGGARPARPCPICATSDHVARQFRTSSPRSKPRRQQRDAHSGLKFGEANSATSLDAPGMNYAHCVTLLCSVSMSRRGFCQSQRSHHLARRAGSSASSADLAASSLGLQPRWELQPSSPRAEALLARAAPGSRGRALAPRRRAPRAAGLDPCLPVRLPGRLGRCARRPGRSCGSRGATRCCSA